jgi:hypothetical protein
MASDITNRELAKVLYKSYRKHHKARGGVDLPAWASIDASQHAVWTSVATDALKELGLGTG